jgi:hypothetical protein
MLVFLELNVITPFPNINILAVLALAQLFFLCVNAYYLDSFAKSWLESLRTSFFLVHSFPKLC